MSEIAAGWYPDPGSPSELRWWDGAAWAAVEGGVPDQVRRSALARSVAAQLAIGGVIVEQGDYWAVVTVAVPADQVNHALYAILTLLTCFLFLPVWIIIAVTAKPARHATYRFDVNRKGYVTARLTSTAAR